MVVKSKLESEHINDLGDIFGFLRRHKLRLNTSKCSFGVGLGKFLGYMVTHLGIEVNPDQIKAINNLQPPQNPKEVQKLTGMTVVLNRFISRLADRCRPFFQLLNKWKGFEWIKECILAFQQLKEYLSRPPIMSRPKVDEVLFAYIAVASHVVSLVLVRVDGGIQRLVYYVSKPLHEAEVCYLPLEKAILAVVHATRKLPHYFQSHTIVVLTQLSLKLLLRSADYTERIAKWCTILGAFNIKYMSRTSVKGQVLAALMAEFAESPLEEEMEKQDMDGKSVGLVSLQEPLSWRVYVDGAANHRRSGVRLVLISPERIIIKKSLRLGFSATNNEVEYEALLVGMTMVQKMGGKVVEIFSDSRLVMGQVQGELEARDMRMKEYLSQVRHLQSGFESFNLQHIPRSGNTHANSLAMLVISSAQSLPRVILVENFCKRTEMKNEVVHIHQIKVGPSWMGSIVLFLEDILLEEKLEADKKEAQEYVKKCDQCQRFAPNIHQPGRVLNPLSSPWPFAQWGLDIVGHFLKAVGNKRYLLVSTDYFTKWIEAEPLAIIRDVDAKKFVWKNIVTRFRIPNTLISDNGLQFDSKAFRRYCCDLGIMNRYSTPAYP
ncbi:uncharacterized protein LOC126691079 [Quercus robur]|uniref:uncharacterized protein LOC126691079 n=1 Tax=Quercus robur TaxID=38942 RepID=UPI00216367D1|nr:uncharacterized protein LOC126691079 [Quercus robur]